MKGIFDYDSPLMQVLGFIADLLIVNVIFLVCCLPIVTIGAAQSGLYNAMRVLQDREDDSSCVKAYFRGFKNGFLKITPAWCLFFVFDLILLYTMLMAWSYRESGLFIHWAVPAVLLLISLLVHSVMTAFHSRFSCSVFQLIRNSCIFLISHPLCSLAVTVITWAPAAVFIAAPALFIQITPLFLTVYYSIGFMLGALVMKKPFQTLIDNFNGVGAELEEKTDKAEEAEAPAE